MESKATSPNYTFTLLNNLAHQSLDHGLGSMTPSVTVQLTIGGTKSNRCLGIILCSLASSYTWARVVLVAMAPPLDVFRIVVGVIVLHISPVIWMLSLPAFVIFNRRDIVLELCFSYLRVHVETIQVPSTCRILPDTKCIDYIVSPQNQNKQW